MKNKLKPQVFTAISALLTLLVIGTISYHYLEKWSWISSFYFTVVTMSTVGYGDLYPTTDLSRLFTAIFILVGVTIAISSIAIIGTGYLNRREEHVQVRRTRKKDNTKRS